MNDPIRGRWTIGPGGYFKGTGRDRCYVLWAVGGPALREPVEVVPVPDEQAIERAAIHLFTRSFTPRQPSARQAEQLWWDGTDNMRDHWRSEARAVLSAALEQPE